MGIACAALNLVRRSATSCCSSSSYLFPNKSLRLLYFSTASTNKPAPNTTPSFPQEFFIEKYQFSTEIASKAASFSARSKTPQNANLVLSFLQGNGFSHSHLERIVRHYPKLLSCCVESNIKPKLKIFEDLGLSADEAAQLVARYLNYLQLGANTTIHKISVLKDLLGSNDRVIKLIKKRPSLLYSNPEKTILPNIQFLKSCGVQVQQINTMLYGKPSFLCISPENMRRCVQKADEMGVQRTSGMFIYAVQTVNDMSAETLELKLKSFRELGFSEDDILRVFQSYPRAIAVSTPKLKEIKEVLLETGKYSMSCIMNNPSLLTRSVEKRYRPRLQVLKVLERKSLITKWPGLSLLGQMTDKRFFEKFVAPNINEVGKAFGAKPAASGKIEAGTGL